MYFQNRRCCWWLGVWKLSLQHIQSLGYSQPRSSLFQLNCSKWPTQKNNGQFLKNGVNPKTFSYFIGYELWIPPHYFPVETCCWVVLLWHLYFLLYIQVRHNHCKMKPCHCLPVFKTKHRGKEQQVEEISGDSHRGFLSNLDKQRRERREQNVVVKME